jgi:hypothetical protein
MVPMGYPEPFRADEVTAHFECRTKSALLKQSVVASEPDIVSDLYRKYRLASLASLERSTGRKLIDFDQLSSVFPASSDRYLVDCRLASSKARILTISSPKRLAAPCTALIARTYHQCIFARSIGFNRGI